MCRPKLSHGTEISCPSKELSEKSLVSVRVKPKIKTRNADIMAMKKFIDKELSNKFEKMELVSVCVKPTISTRNADIMSMKKFMDKETQTDGNPSAMRRLYPSLPSKGEIINISSNESDNL